MNPGLLADLVIAVHFAYVAFVICGLIVIWVGKWRGWRWVANPVFRVLHLIAILVVAGEAIAGIPCPLTVWERDLRLEAGQATTGDTFIGRLLHEVLFVEFPPAVLTCSYVLFAILVGLSFWKVPPRWRRS